MKLQIELWEEKLKPFGEESEQLFKESVMCYKVGAYTSAFLMSYLAFRTAVRHRILKCTYRPSRYTSNEPMWNSNISGPLKNDDSWEDGLDKILEAADGNVKAIIHFENREKALIELKYWRNIRNACAHAKKSIIDSSTVESFWNYLRDNMAKFYVLGGKEYLVEKMFEHYKYYKVDSRIRDERSLLIHDIKTVYDEPAEFFQQFFQILETNNIHIFVNIQNVDFWKEFIDTDYEELQIGIVQELMKHELIFFSFYDEFPKILGLSMSIDSRFTREVLSKWLANSVAWLLHTNTFWEITCSVLKHNKECLDIDAITKDLDLEFIDGITFSSGQLAILNDCDFFNKTVLGKGKYIFNVDYDSIKRNNGFSENIVIPWFNYVNWNRISYFLDRAIREITTEIQKQQGKGYGGMEIKRKEIFEQIVRNNKEKILAQFPREQLDKVQYIKDLLEV